MLDIEPPEDILGFLRDLDLRGEATGAEQEAADEIEQLRARVERAEADADRLADAMTVADGRNHAHVMHAALLAHDKEVATRGPAPQPTTDTSPTTPTPRRTQ